MQNFTKYLESKNFAKSTQYTHLRYIDKFLGWYDQEVINCTKKDILKYLEYQKNQKEQSNRSRQLILNSLNHYFTFLVLDGQIENNPTSMIKIRGTRKKILYNIYSMEQLIIIYDDYYHNFIRNFDGRHIPASTRQRSVLSRQRNYIMLGLFLFQGIASYELHKITLQDVDLTKAVINIPASRKSNERKIPLNASQIGSLIHYINNIRPQFLEYYKGNSDALFLPLPENHKSTTHAKKLLGTIQDLAEQVKILDENFLNLKQIRASVITHWLKTEGLRKAQYLAGHCYISSTEYYLPNDLESLTDDIAKFNPFD